ncbi:MAG TPA: amidohydrolase family protein [Longimicrobium sp.]|jgi:cytosine/adenosine deaminase-related metal-dependent hydrolase
MPTPARPARPFVRLALALLPALLPAAGLHAQRAYLLQGTVVSMDRPPFEGYVLVRDSAIALVGAGAPPAEAAGAVRVGTTGVIYPGLLDSHNHPTYNVLPLWNAPRRYDNRYQWRRGEPAYATYITRPYGWLRDSVRVSTQMAVWAEVRALAGGTTALQGWGPRDALLVDGDLARAVEAANYGHRFAGGTAIDLPQGAVLGPKHDSLAALSPWLLHLAEGRPGDSVSVRQADSLSLSGLLSPRLTVIHGTAVPVAQLRAWADSGVSVTWSPISNGLLYGATTPIDSVWRAGVNVSLGSDWGPSGSKNLLGELKAADLWNQAHGRPFSDSLLVAMVTVHPARALQWQAWAGTVTPGKAADLVVLDRIRMDPYRNLIEATERNVQLVLVGGRPMYGDADVLEPLYPGGVETVGTLLGRAKALAPPATPARPAFAAVQGALQRAFADTVLAWRSHLDPLFTATDTAYFGVLAAKAGPLTWLAGIESYYRRPAATGPRSTFAYARPDLSAPVAGVFPPGVPVTVVEKVEVAPGQWWALVSPGLGATRAVGYVPMQDLAAGP